MYFFSISVGNSFPAHGTAYLGDPNDKGYSHHQNTLLGNSSSKYSLGCPCKGGCYLLERGEEAGLGGRGGVAKQYIDQVAVVTSYHVTRVVLIEGEGAPV